MPRRATIYHNPRCTKSCQTLQLMQDQGVEPHVVKYLDTPPDAKTLRELIRMLGIRPIDLIRQKEPLYQELKLSEKQDDDDALIQAMVDHPILIERPIVVNGQEARLGRPPEKVLEII